MIFMVLMIFRNEFLEGEINSNISNIMNLFLLLSIILLSTGLAGSLYIDVKQMNNKPVVEQYKVTNYIIKKENKNIILEYTYIDKVGVERIGTVNVNEFEHVEISSESSGTLTLQYIPKYTNILFLTENYESKLILTFQQ